MEVFFNYLRSNSVILMVLSDHIDGFQYISDSADGSTSDGGFSKNCIKMCIRDS